MLARRSAPPAALLVRCSLVAVLAACGPAAPPPVAAPAEVALPSAPPAPPAPEGAEPAPPEPRTEASAEPPPIVFAAPAACALETDRWRAVHPLTSLRLRPGGPAFAHVTHPAARLHLPVGPAARGAGLEVEDKGLVLRGHIDGDAVTLRAAEAFTMGGFAIPVPGVPLGWAAAEPDRVTVTLAPGHGVEVISPPLTATVRCGVAGLDPGARFDPSAAIGTGKPLRKALLPLGGPTELRVTPGSPPAARLLPRDDADALVQVLEVQGSQSRIWWRRHDVLVFGWVPSAALRPPPKDVSWVGYGTGSGGGRGRSVHSIELVTCAEEIPVVVEVGGERATAGLIRAGTVIDVMTRGEAYADVYVRASEVRMADGARLLARAERLRACEAAAPKAAAP